MWPSGDSPIHAIPAEQALVLLDSTREGLGKEEAARRLLEYGPNRLPEGAGTSVFLIVLHQFQSPFIYVLLAAAVLSLIIGQHMEAALILAVLVVNAVIGGWQEWQADRRVRGLKVLLRGFLPVWREGRLISVDVEHLVPGDIVQLESGLKVPADMRLLEAKALLVDESRLTGESVPIEKRADQSMAPQSLLTERPNMLFAGTTIFRGRGRGLVAATGVSSEMGRMSRALHEPPTPTPLMRRMERFSRQLGVAVLVLILVIAAIEFLRGGELTTILLVAVALAVSAVPEALPIATTIVLSISVRRMGQKNVVVRHMSAVEGLGACTVIATDKTGTLTVNRLTVDTIWLPRNDRNPAGRVRPTDSRVRAFSFAAARCSESHGADINHLGEEIGDSVDLAFLRLAASANYDAVMDALSHRGRIAYEPERRYAASFHTDGGILVGYVKGAPETVLALCGADEWPSESKLEAERAIHDLAESGFRVIAVAAGAVESADPKSLRNLALLGFAGLIDPLRPEAPAAVTAARRAGLRVIMVTGDHPATSCAIARQLGILDEDDDREVITGTQLRVLDGNRAAFDLAVSGAKVFARMEPLQKLEIVQSLQRQGHIVAVTGDGINDAAALHAADIGVAMGRGGTDVAREAADLILVDDNFASIVAGIEEGRAAYANLRKVILHCVATGMAGLLLMLLSTLAGLPLPLTAVQILWLNLISNGIQDVSLGFEKPEDGLMLQPPRRADSSIFDRRMVEQILLSGGAIGVLSFGVYFYLFQVSGGNIAAAQGLMLWLMLWFENAHVLNCRSETRSIFVIAPSANWILMAGVVATQILQAAVGFMPGISALLRLESVRFDQVALMAVSALALTAIMEAYKRLRPIHAQ
jgi:Ca2+-transporting ATPase